MANVDHTIDYVKIIPNVFKQDTDLFAKTAKESYILVDDTPPSYSIGSIMRCVVKIDLPTLAATPPHELDAMTIIFKEGLFVNYDFETKLQKTTFPDKPYYYYEINKKGQVYVGSTVPMQFNGEPYQNNSRWSVQFVNEGGLLSLLIFGDVLLLADLHGYGEEFQSNSKKLFYNSQKNKTILDNTALGTVYNTDAKAIRVNTWITLDLLADIDRTSNSDIKGVYRSAEFIGDFYYPYTNSFITTIPRLIKNSKVQINYLDTDAPPGTGFDVDYFTKALSNGNNISIVNTVFEFDRNVYNPKVIVLLVNTTKLSNAGDIFSSDTIIARFGEIEHTNNGANYETYQDIYLIPEFLSKPQNVSLRNSGINNTASKTVYNNYTDYVLCNTYVDAGLLNEGDTYAIIGVCYFSSSENPLSARKYSSVSVLKKDIKIQKSFASDCKPEVGSYITDYIRNLGNKCIVSPQERLRLGNSWYLDTYDRCRNYIGNTSIKYVKYVTSYITYETSTESQLVAFFQATPVAGSASIKFESKNKDYQVTYDEGSNTIESTIDLRIRYEHNIGNILTTDRSGGFILSLPTGDQDWVEKNFRVKNQLIINYTDPYAGVDTFNNIQLFKVHNYDHACLQAKFYDEENNEIKVLCNTVKTIKVVVTSCNDDILPGDENEKDYWIAGIDKEIYSLSNFREYEAFHVNEIKQLTESPLETKDKTFSAKDGGQTVTYIDATALEDHTQYRFVAIKKKGHIDDLIPPPPPPPPPTDTKLHPCDILSIDPTTLLPTYIKIMLPIDIPCPKPPPTKDPSEKTKTKPCDVIVGYDNSNNPIRSIVLVNENDPCPGNVLPVVVEVKHIICDVITGYDANGTPIHSSVIVPEGVPCPTSITLQTPPPTTKECRWVTYNSKGEGVINVKTVAIGDKCPEDEPKPLVQTKDCTWISAWDKDCNPVLSHKVVGLLDPCPVDTPPLSKTCTYISSYSPDGTPVYTTVSIKTCSDCPPDVAKNTRPCTYIASYDSMCVAITKTIQVPDGQPCPDNVLPTKKCCTYRSGWKPNGDPIYTTVQVLLADPCPNDVAVPLPETHPCVSRSWDNCIQLDQLVQVPVNTPCPPLLDAPTHICKYIVGYKPDGTAIEATVTLPCYTPCPENAPAPRKCVYISGWTNDTPPKPIYTTVFVTGTNPCPNDVAAPRTNPCTYIESFDANCKPIIKTIFIGWDEKCPQSALLPVKTCKWIIGWQVDSNGLYQPVYDTKEVMKCDPCPIDAVKPTPALVKKVPCTKIKYDIYGNPYVTTEAINENEPCLDDPIPPITEGLLDCTCADGTGYSGGQEYKIFKINIGITYTPLNVSPTDKTIRPITQDKRYVMVSMISLVQSDGIRINHGPNTKFITKKTSGTNNWDDQSIDVTGINKGGKNYVRDGYGLQPFDNHKEDGINIYQYYPHGEPPSLLSGNIVTLIEYDISKVSKNNTSSGLPQWVDVIITSNQGRGTLWYINAYCPNALQSISITSAFLGTITPYAAIGTEYKALCTVTPPAYAIKHLVKHVLLRSELVGYVLTPKLPSWEAIKQIPAVTSGGTHFTGRLKALPYFYEASRVLDLFNNSSNKSALLTIKLLNFYYTTRTIEEDVAIPAVFAEVKNQPVAVVRLFGPYLQNERFNGVRTNNVPIFEKIFTTQDFQKGKLVLGSDSNNAYGVDVQTGSYECNIDINSSPLVSTLGPATTTINRLFILTVQWVQSIPVIGTSVKFTKDLIPTVEITNNL